MLSSFLLIDIKFKKFSSLILLMRELMKIMNFMKIFKKELRISMK